MHREKVEPFVPIFTQENETQFERKCNEFYSDFNKEHRRTASVPKSLGTLQNEFYQ